MSRILLKPGSTHSLLLRSASFLSSIYSVRKLFLLSPRDATTTSHSPRCANISSVQMSTQASSGDCLVCHLTYVAIDAPSNASISIDLRAATLYICTSRSVYEARQYRTRRQRAGCRGASASSCTAKAQSSLSQAPVRDVIPRAGETQANACQEEV